MLYRTYSSYLKEKYGEKVYKLPVHLPVTCPNRDGTKGTGGCIFCSGVGAGFELLDAAMPVAEQLAKNKAYMGRRYGANKFIAYFQNYSNTYLPVEQFRAYMEQACIEGVVELAVSTRPDCISAPYLEVLKAFQQKGLSISVELGLQSANDRTLEIINRGHTVADFEAACTLIHAYGFEVVAHLIPNLPWDTKDDVLRCADLMNRCVDGVKLHSLYIPKGTMLAEWYQSGKVEMIPLEEFVERVILLLEHLRSDIVVHRLLGRAGEAFTVFENYGRSWWRIKEQIEETMAAEGRFQGRLNTQPPLKTTPVRER